MTRLGVKLDAEQGRNAILRQRSGDWRQIDVIEYLLAIAPSVFRSELRARALTDSETVVLAVLKLA